MLDEVLEVNGLAHLRQLLAGATLADLAALERAPLLAKLKAIGVERLGDRQKAATAIAKTARSPPAAASEDVPSSSRYDHLTPQGFQIFCHNTTLADGTSLDNHKPAPEFIIAALEQRTGVKRPANADKCNLHKLNLHFMAGGIS
jgi:hypothetical protein